ncbi:MAG: hypothetical protein J6W02_05835 [Bacteroidaceae bacterium]|nr:hypothetical protein [Bacteroidaceae bacterium]
MLSIFAWADDYDYLAFQKTDNSIVAFASRDIQISFSDTSTSVKTADGETYSFTTADLEKMYFNATDNSTNAINSLLFDGTEEIELFTTSGVSVGKYSSIESASNSLPRGIYIAKSSTQSKASAKIVLK